MPCYSKQGFFPCTVTPSTLCTAGRMSQVNTEGYSLTYFQNNLFGYKNSYKIHKKIPVSSGKTKNTKKMYWQNTKIE